MILTIAGAALLLLACGSQPASTPPTAIEVPPRAENLVPPEYPEEARKAGVEGTAMVEVLVADDGAVLACSVATSSGNSFLDEAALGAARSSKFVPGTIDGKPAKMKVTVPFRFKLDEKPKEPRGQVPGGTYRAVLPDDPQCREARPPQEA